MYAYVAEGTYSVKLTATDPSGAVDTSIEEVTVTSVGYPVAATVVERDAIWSWYYESAAPQSDWKEVGADLSSWQTGAATLGSGYSGIDTDIDIDGPTSGSIFCSRVRPTPYKSGWTCL